MSTIAFSAACQKNELQSEQPTTRPEAIQLTNPCIGDSKERCEDSAERVALRTLTGWQRAQPNRLVFRSSSGRELILTDDTTEGDAYVVNRLLGEIPNTGYAAVERRFYEELSVLLVQKSTGDTLSVLALPVMSPDSRRGVIVSMDLEAEYVPNVIQIWRFEGPRPLLEFEMPTDTSRSTLPWGPSDPSWRGSDTILVTQNVPAPYSVGIYTKTQRMFVHIGSTWRLVDAVSQRR